MRRNGVGRKEVRVTPVNINSFQCICVIAGPELGKIFHRSIVSSAAATRTKHDGQLRILFTNTFQNFIKASCVFNKKMCLFVFEKWWILVGHAAVAIPLNKSKVWIFCKQVIYNIKNKVLHLRVAQIQYQLIAAIIFCTVRKLEYPVRMLLIQFAFWIDHFRFQPYTEFDSFGFRLSHQVTNTTGKFCAVFCPITQSGFIIVTRIFISKPSIIQ